MSILNRNLTTPQSSGFEYNSASVTFESTSSLTASLITPLSATFSVVGTVSSGLFPALQSSIVGSGTLSSLVVTTLACSMESVASFEGTLDSDVFMATLSVTGELTGTTSLATDNSILFASVATLSGELREPLTLTFSATSSLIITDALGLNTSYTGSSSLSGVLVEAMKASVVGNITFGGQITLPDWLDATFVSSGTLTGTPVPALNASSVAASSLSGQLILLQAAPFSTTFLVTGSVSTTTFLQTNPDLKTSLTTIGNLSGRLLPPATALRKLGKIKLVHSKYRGNY